MFGRLKIMYYFCVLKSAIPRQAKASKLPLVFWLNEIVVIFLPHSWLFPLPRMIADILYPCFVPASPLCRSMHHYSHCVPLRQRAEPLFIYELSALEGRWRRARQIYLSLHRIIPEPIMRSKIDCFLVSTLPAVSYTHLTLPTILLV